jgi:multidrug efflux pump subunit AcrA (membrane-fusion protein)
MNFQQKDIIMLKIWKRLKKRWKILIVILLLVGIFLIYRGISGAGKKNAQQSIEVVTRGNITKEVSRTGQVELQGVVSVRPPISGTIEQLLVANDQVVKKGELLFVVKSNATDSEKSSAYASYVAAKLAYEEALADSGTNEWSEFENAKLEMITVEDEVKKFRDDNPDQVKHDNLEYQKLLQKERDARTALNKALAKTTHIKDRLTIAKANWLASQASYQAALDGKYTSPIDGTIANLGVNQDESVRADVGDKDGTALFLIIPEGKKTISMQVGPSDAKSIKVGSAAVVTSELVKEATFAAVVARIDNVAKVGDAQSGGATYRVWLELDDPQDQILLGTSAEIQIKLENKENVVLVPNNALINGAVTVTDAQGQTKEERLVETGIKAQGMVEIVSGLEEGEYILIDYGI